VRRVPWPGWLAAVTVTLCACASSAAIASPIPLREVWAAAWPRENNDGTRLQIWDCNGQIQQSWRVP
jgi:hypothetical protein